MTISCSGSDASFPDATLGYITFLCPQTLLCPGDMHTNMHSQGVARGVPQVKTELSTYPAALAI
jgi:hypothetical protein